MLASAGAAAAAAAVVLVGSDAWRSHVLVAIALAATVVLFGAAARHRRSRRVWSAYAVAGLLLTAKLALRDQADGRAATALLLALASVGAPVMATWAGARVARPLLSYGPLRRGTQWVIGLHLVGAAALVFTDPVARSITDSRVAFVTCAVLTVVGSAIAVTVALGVPELRRTGRSVEAEVGLAGAVCFVLVAASSVDLERLWPTGGVAALIISAGASLGPSASQAGQPVRSRPMITTVPLRWALLTGMPLAALIPALHLGAPPVLAVACLVLTVVPAAGFARALRSGGMRAPRTSARIASVAGALHDAIVFEHWELHDDPIVRVHDGVTVGFEAQLSWRHPVVGDVRRHELLEAADMCGLRTDVERHLLTMACRRLPGVIASLTADEPFVAVDLSPVTLAQASFAEDLIDQVRRSNGTLDGLVIEVSDAGDVHDWDTFRHNVALLQNAGVLIALDDFGGGSSNLQYLSAIDVDIVKVDPVLMRPGGNVRERAVLSHLVAIARHAGARVVATGVEHRDALTLLAPLRFDFVQGPVVCEPPTASGHLHDGSTPAPEAAQNWSGRLGHSGVMP
jgi:EAL domain-containing protein (putative c-di-GMP-specific phosphodiesterase class I)